MRDYSEKLGKFLEDYVENHSISFLREDPYIFAKRLFKAFSLFSISSSEKHIFEGLKEKTLYTLWNMVLDDIIEYTDQGMENIFESFEVLIALKREKNIEIRTETGQIIYDFIKGFYDMPSGPNKKISEELLFLDLIRVLNGFDYERIIHENNFMGSLSEYMEFGAITIDLRPDLDIDIAIYPENLELSIIRSLREACKWFSAAFKLISDIATFEREFFVEKSQNAIILYGQEKDLLPENILKFDKKHKKKLIKDTIPQIMEKIEQKSKEYLSISLKCLDEVNEIETSNIAKAFISMCKDYPGQKDFSPPK